MNRNNLAVVALGAASVFSACSQDTVYLPLETQPGSLNLALTVSGLSLDSVRVDIRSETIEPPVFRSRTIDVSDDNALLTATEGGLPEDNYTVSLDAHPVDDPSTAVDESTIECSGEVQGVTVLPGQVTEVNDLVLLCTLDGGQVVVSGGIQVRASVGVETESACGELIDEMFVGVQQTSVGGQVTLHSVVDSSASLLWSATGGSIASATSADTVYTCSATPGTHVVSLLATSSETCSRGLSVSVTCVGEGTSEVCGDGVVNGSEECDGGASCEADCTLSDFCGDGVVNGSEECDGGANCEANCTLSDFCGDGVVNGNEECDGGANCAADCTVVVTGGGDDVATACEACLTDPSQEAAFRDFNEQLCNGDPLCVAVKQCVLNDTSGAAGASCFTGIPAECYCGIGSDLEACETDASFAATGACAAEILAGVGAGAASTDVLPRFFDPGFSTGAAMAIVDEASRICAAECQL